MSPADPRPGRATAASAGARARGNELPPGTRPSIASKILDWLLDHVFRLALRVMVGSLGTKTRATVERAVHSPGLARGLRVIALRMGRQSRFAAALDRKIEHHRRSYAALLYLRGMGALGTDGGYRSALADLDEATREGFRTASAYFHLGMARMRLGDVRGAEAAYREALRYDDNWAQLYLNLACVLLIVEEREAALPLLKRAIEIDPKFAMAHQNLAAKYDREAYRLQPLDLEVRDECVLYDAYNRAGELAIHAGMGRRGVELFLEALRIQQRSAEGRVLPADCIGELSRIRPFDPALPTRILSYEWVTQIGHLAMLDTYLKAVSLGWRSRANYVLLAPRDKVSNPRYLDCWRSRLVVVEDDGLVTRLFPWQRYFGDCFNAAFAPDGTGLSFPEFGARVHIEWDHRGWEPLLALGAQEREAGFAALARLGMPDGSWFVTLHVREGGFHREHGSVSQAHRNASILDYELAIREVTRRGGWVVRVGDRSMQRLPPMPRVIDYARSAEKSAAMDVFLCAAARLFIGTTSGLTNAVISFGTPCVLVNCISNFAQLWPASVTYCLKPFWSEPSARYLPLEETLREEFRGNIFDLRVLAAHGVAPENNASEDILAAVAERLVEVIDGAAISGAATERINGILKRVADGRPIYGNGRASAAFFERRERLFFDDRE
jgi:putative glycosyltransferase (TIGR04372 family)